MRSSVSHTVLGSRLFLWPQPPPAPTQAREGPPGTAHIPSNPCIPGCCFSEAFWRVHVCVSTHVHACTRVHASTQAQGWAQQLCQVAHAVHL